MDNVHGHLRGDAPVLRRRPAARPGTVGLYLAAYEGELHAFLDDDHEQLAGHARLFVLNADGAERDGESLCNLLDMRPETAAFIPLLGDEDGELAHAALCVLDEPVRACRNMLLLDRFEILPPVRGQELGLKYTAAAIIRLGLGCRLVAARPLPQAGHSGKPAGRTAKTKLRRYYARAGFVPLARSDLMILDLDTQRQDGR
jgi:hypothetical protein